TWMAHVLPEHGPSLSPRKRASEKADAGDAPLLLPPQSNPLCLQAFQPWDGHARDAGYPFRRARFAPRRRDFQTVPIPTSRDCEGLRTPLASDSGATPRHASRPRLKVLLLTRYGRLGASSRLRAYQYLPYLRSQGFQITTMPFFGDYYQYDLYAGRPRRWWRIAEAYAFRLLQLARSTSFDLVWIEYELFPWLPALGERLLTGLRIPYVVDYDDAIYHRYQLHRNSLVRVLLG